MRAGSSAHSRLLPWLPPGVLASSQARLRRTPAAHDPAVAHVSFSGDVSPLFGASSRKRGIGPPYALVPAAATQPTSIALALTLPATHCRQAASSPCCWSRRCEVLAQLAVAAASSGGHRRAAVTRRVSRSDGRQACDFVGRAAGCRSSHRAESPARHCRDNARREAWCAGTG